jgi:hypothetical protein
MTTHNGQRTTDKPNWRLYAAAGAATLAAAASADAAIIYVNPTNKPNATIGGPAPYLGTVTAKFSIDGLASSYIKVHHHTTPPHFDNAAVASVHNNSMTAVNGPGVKWQDTSHGNLMNFNAGQAIALEHGSHSGTVRGKETVMGRLSGSVGSFAFSKTGFAGFQLPASKGGGLGWMRFEVFDRNGDGFPDELQAIDWAYNNAGGGINAGQTSVPEPSALGLLALGSAGVLAWRRRRETTADSR